MRALTTTTRGVILTATLAGLGCSLPSVEDFIKSPTEEEDTFAPPPPPTFDPVAGFEVVEIIPDVGIPKGFDLVEIHGGGFREDSRVFFGGSEAVQVTVASAGVLYVLTPPHSPGLVAVRVVNIDGTTAELSPGFAYTDPVALTAITPSEGPSQGGMPVQLTGRGLSLATAVLVGGREVVSLQVLDDTSALAVLPGRSRAGLVDLHLVTPFGTAELPKAYRYLDDLSLAGLSPLAGPAAGGGTLTLVGRGLANAVKEPGDSLAPRVLLGGLDAPVLAVASDGSRVVVRTPAGAAGPADLEVVTHTGKLRLEGAYRWLDGSEQAGFLAVHPPAGPSTGGAEVQLAVVGGSAQLDVPIVRFGASVATVLESSAGAGGYWNITVVVPPGPAGAAEVSVTDVPGTATYDYYAALGVSSVSPAVGSRAGGARVTLEGTGLEAVDEVLFGGLPATSLEHTDEGHLRVTTPAGSPGPVDVIVRSGGGANEALRAGGYEYRAGSAALHALDPARGAIAGNTLVRLYGTDFPEDVTVDFGGAVVDSVERVSSSELRLRSPRATEVGLVDVRVSGSGLDQTLHQGFSYFDPVNGYGGTWGEPIDGSLNVTVVQSGTGDRVADALVVVGSAYPPRLAGYTDDRGQVTLSASDLEGRLDVTAAKAGFSASSIMAFDAENATLMLAGPAPPATGPGPTPLLPGPIVGTVDGVGKHLRLPPWPCAEIAGRQLGFCGSCEADADCPGTAPLCTRVTGARPFCSAACAADADCSRASSYTGADPDFVCSQVTDGAAEPRCVPYAGRSRAECHVSNSSYMQSPPAVQVGGVIDLASSEREFALVGTRLGEVAVYCLAGGYRETSEGPVFKPVLLGVARHRSVLPGAADGGTPTPPTEVDIVLDIPLTSTVDVYFGRQPLAASGPNETLLFASIDLGSDGFIPLAGQRAPPTVTALSVTGLPSLTSPSLVGSEYVFYGMCNTPTGNSALPEADVQRVGISALELGEALVNATGSPEAWSVEPVGAEAKILAAVALGTEGGVLAGTRDGAVLHFDGSYWSPQPITRGPALFAAASTGQASGGTVGALLAGDEGRVVHWDGDTWSIESTGPHLHRGMARVEPGRYAIVGRYSLLEGAPGEWEEIPVGPPKDLTAVAAWSTPSCSPGQAAAAPDECRTALAVGLFGAVLSRAPTGDWEVAEVPVHEHLRAVTTLVGGRAVAVGDRGTALHLENGEWLTRPTGTAVDLYAVANEGETIYAAGDNGTVVAFDGDTWKVVAEESANAGLRALVYAGAGGPAARWMALGEPAIRVGPFLDVPAFTAPALGGPWLGYRFAWTHEGRSPAFHSLRIYGQAGVIWSITAPGGLRELVLPDLNSIGGETLVPAGPKSALMTSADHPAFDIDGFSTEVVNVGAWHAWTYRLHDFDQTAGLDFLE